MIIFAADAFVEQYVGGAELTTQAIIESCLHPSARALTGNISIQLMKDAKDCFWIFGNFANLSNDCMLYAVKNLKYSVL